MSHIKLHNELVHVLVALQQSDTKVIANGKEIKLSSKAKHHLSHLIVDNQ